MGRPNLITAAADALGRKACTRCGKVKRASRDPAVSCFYVVTRRGRQGAAYHYYMGMCKTCHTIAAGERRRAADNRWSRQYYRAARQDPEWRAKRNRAQQEYRRRRPEVSRRYWQTAAGLLVRARASNRSRLRKALAAGSDSRVAQLERLIAAQTAEIGRIRERKRAEEARDASPKHHGVKAFKKLLSSIHQPEDRP